MNVHCWRRQIPFTETRESSIPTPATGAHAGAGLLGWFPAWYQPGFPWASPSSWPGGSQGSCAGAWGGAERQSLGTWEWGQDGMRCTTGNGVGGQSRSILPAATTTVILSEGEVSKGTCPCRTGRAAGRRKCPFPFLVQWGGGTHSMPGFGVTPPGTPEPEKLLLLSTDPWVCAPLARAAGLPKTPSLPHRGIPSPPTTAQSRQKLREWLEARGKGLQL